MGEAVTYSIPINDISNQTIPTNIVDFIKRYSPVSVGLVQRYFSVELIYAAVQSGRAKLHGDVLRKTTL